MILQYVEEYQEMCALNNLSAGNQRSTKNGKFHSCSMSHITQIQFKLTISIGNCPHLRICSRKT